MLHAEQSVGKPGDLSVVNGRALQCEEDVMLEVSGLGVHLGGKDIIDGIDLSLREGEILAIIGPSGCGKTTFLNTLNRMIDLTMPEATISGDIRLRDTSILSEPTDTRALRKEIGMVFQRPNPFPFSIRKNLEFALKANGSMSRTERPERIHDVLVAVDLWNEVHDRLDMPACVLSGGQQQRLCIARALITDPKIILFDEPCSALDPMSSANVERLIVSLKHRCSSVIVTHDLAQARRVSDTCAVFWQENSRGYLVETGCTESLFRSPREKITSHYVTGKIS